MRTLSPQENPNWKSYENNQKVYNGLFPLTGEAKVQPKDCKAVDSSESVGLALKNCSIKETTPLVNLIRIRNNDDNQETLKIPGTRLHDMMH